MESEEAITQTLILYATEENKIRDLLKVTLIVGLCSYVSVLVAILGDYVTPVVVIYPNLLNSPISITPPIQTINFLAIERFIFALAFTISISIIIYYSLRFLNMRFEKYEESLRKFLKLPNKVALVLLIVRIGISFLFLYINLLFPEKWIIFIVFCVSLSLLDTLDSPPESWKYNDKPKILGGLDDIVDILSRFIIFIPYFRIWWVWFLLLLMGIGATLALINTRLRIFKMLGSDVLFLVPIWIFWKILFIPSIIATFIFQLILYMGFLYPDLLKVSKEK